MFNKLVLDRVEIAATSFLLSHRSLRMALAIKRKRLQHPLISLQACDTDVWRKGLEVKCYKLIPCPPLWRFSNLSLIVAGYIILKIFRVARRVLIDGLP